MITKTNKASRFGLGCSAASLALGIAFAGAPAFAQKAPGTPAAAADDNSEEQVIVVTGSRIPQPNLTGTAPVTVVSNQEIKLQGTTRTEDLLNSLPQVFGDQGGNLANGASGTATVNLRGLGPNRTLVLINGKRLGPGDPNSPTEGSAADINFIPASLVKSVQVLTGGASSTYGSDAVAGVVNFIMDTDFEGFRIDSQESLYQHDNNESVLDAASAARGFAIPKGNAVDGGTTDVTVSFGGKFGSDDQGHFMAYVGYRKLKAVTQDKRDYSSCGAQAAAAANTVTCGGSATSKNGTFFDWASNTYQVGPNRTLIPGFTPYNFGPLNYYQRPDQRFTAGVFADYEINEHFHPYMEAMFMDDRTVAQIAQSGDFGNTLSVNCDNPLLSPQELAIVCANGSDPARPSNLVTSTLPTGFPIVTAGAPPQNFVDPTTGAIYNKGFLEGLRRDVEGGPRRDDLQHTDFRIVTGLKGDINKAFSYDLSYLFSRANLSETYTGEFSASRLNKATDVVTNPATGQPVCRSALAGTDPTCVPYDIFALGTVSQAAVNYLEVPGLLRGHNDEMVIDGNVTGELGEYGIQTPWAKNGMGINVGVEYRRESLQLITDAEYQAGDLTGQGAATLPSSGHYDVKEVFGEFQLPVIDDGIVYKAEIDGGYRYSHYSSGFNTNTFKIAGIFAPIRDITFRGGFNRAVRAPNVSELFAPVHVALDGTSDPCTGSAVTAAQCALTGLAPGNFPVAGNPAGQYNGLIGGNAALKPEKSNTITFGAVIEPRFIHGLSATIDWYDIKVKNDITTYGANVIINQCLATGDPTFCGLIHRDPTGSLWRTPSGFIVDTDLNIGSVHTRGIDFGLNYSRPVWKGKISLSFNGTYLDKFVTNDGVSTPYDCAGYYGATCLDPAPKFRHKTRLSYQMENGFGLSVAWRYFSAVKIDLSSTNPTLNGNFSPFNAKIPSQSYFDLAGTYSINDKYTLRLGVENIFDKAPPIIGSNGATAVTNACPAVTCSGNTFPNVYDALGRYMYAGVTLNF